MSLIIARTFTAEERRNSVCVRQRNDLRGAKRGGKLAADGRRRQHQDAPRTGMNGGHPPSSTLRRDKPTAATMQTPHSDLATDFS